MMSRMGAWCFGAAAWSVGLAGLWRCQTPAWCLSRRSGVGPSNGSEGGRPSSSLELDTQTTPNTKHSAPPQSLLDGERHPDTDRTEPVVLDFGPFSMNIGILARFFSFFVLLFFSSPVHARHETALLSARLNTLAPFPPHIPSLSTQTSSASASLRCSQWAVSARFAPRT